MRLVWRLFEFPSDERRLILRAWVVTAGIRWRLWGGDYRALEARVLSRNMGVRGSVPADALAVAVRRASRLVPAPTCLVQALAAAWMLRGAGYEPTLYIGVATGEEGFKAHAWLECDGRVLIGGETKDEYHPFERP